MNSHTLRAMFDMSLVLALYSTCLSLERQIATQQQAQRHADQGRDRLDAEYEQVMADHRRMNSIDGECTEITDRRLISHQPCVPT